MHKTKTYGIQDQLESGGKKVVVSMLQPTPNTSHNLKAFKPKSKEKKTRWNLKDTTIKMKNKEWWRLHAFPWGIELVSLHTIMTLISSSPPPFNWDSSKSQNIWLLFLPWQGQRNFPNVLIDFLQQIAMATFLDAFSIM